MSPKGKTYLAALARFQELMQVSHADTADHGNTVRLWPGPKQEAWFMSSEKSGRMGYCKNIREELVISGCE